MNVLYAVQIDVIGFLILTILISGKRNKAGLSESQKLFNILIYSTMGILLCDALCFLLLGRDFPYIKELLILVNTVYFILNAVIPAIWFFYACFYFGCEQWLFRWRVILFLPLAFSLAVVFISPFTGILYRINEQNLYERGVMMLPFSIACLLYLIIPGIIAAVKAKTTNQSDERHAYYFFPIFTVFPLTCSILQFAFYGLDIIWIGCTISILVMNINVQNRLLVTDYLTGLNNRYWFEKHLRLKINKLEHSDEKKEKLIVLMMDIDNFKKINDTSGHIYGDNVLRCVARVITDSLAGMDAFIARYGGDEFVAVCSIEANAEEAKVIAHFNQCIIENCSLYKISKNISISVGYSVYSGEQGAEADKLIHMADCDMYETKRKIHSKDDD